ncbi:PPK2 family polyphosphate kinase [Micromonospora sp. LOL_023]|uniref:PPK2 family polyphosphate kinase n=1 Tax=Micromonospora sp. LOL_023 TaxID=3345418 RepID=UPI003A87A1E5
MTAELSDVPVRELLRIGVGQPVDLAAIDPRSTPGLPGLPVTGPDRKAWARDEVRRLGAGLARQQEMLFAQAVKAPASARRVLLVLQAMDCGGKGGAVKRVAGAMNPLGLHIRAFGAPTAEELDHHFLWRVRRALPAPGYVGVFDRSHYEDVLVVRVDSLVPEDVWRPRYDEINEFEAGLVDDGFVLIKVFLHISYEEQRVRLMSRLTDPTKHWKYHPSDVAARAQWPEYQAAYAEALRRCASDAAPWHVLPADRKWYRDWALAHLLREHFADLELTYPPADFDLRREQARLLSDTSGKRKMNGS